MGVYCMAFFFNLPTLFLKASCLKIINFLSGYYFFLSVLSILQNSPSCPGSAFVTALAEKSKSRANQQS
jgi:hypothetical protein